MLDIILRTCSRRESQVHGTERIHPKEEVLLRCFRSLLTSINSSKYKDKIKLTIIDDNSDHNIFNKMRNEPLVNRILKLRGMGNSTSLHSVYDYARENFKNELIYFLEDDYLHEETAIDEMLDFYYLTKERFKNTKEIAIFPLDGNDRYKPYWLQPCFIVPGEKRYWRTIDSTTGTQMISRKLFEKYFIIFKRFADYGIDPEVHEETTINKIWRDVNGATCFSPIPTLVYHLQLEEHLPYYTNYKKLWEKNKF